MVSKSKVQYKVCVFSEDWANCKLKEKTNRKGISGLYGLLEHRPASMAYRRLQELDI